MISLAVIWDIDTRLKILAGLNLQHLIIITKKYIVTYIEEYDDRGHELDSYNTNAGWEDVEANDGTFMGMLMQKAADNSSRDYQLLYYDPRTHPHKSHK